MSLETKKTIHIQLTGLTNEGDRATISANIFVEGRSKDAIAKYSTIAHKDNEKLQQAFELIESIVADKFAGGDK